MSLLLSNDDGIEAPGLQLLYEVLRGEDELLIIAPRENRSGIGHAVTFDHPVRIETFPLLPDVTARLAVHGTPADAVKFALKHHMITAPSLVVSGVNNGPNVGVNVLYSGTLGAALEGLIHGVSAVAVSTGWEDAFDRDLVAELIRRTVRMATEMDAARRAGTLSANPFCLNLNIPAIPREQFRGLRLTRQGRSGFDESFHPHNGSDDEFRIDGEMVIRDPDESFDAAALEAGFATLTPLRIDLTCPELLAHIAATDPSLERPLSE